MKRRDGFVSNSSSSSFVVAFPKRPRNASDMKKIVFGDQDTYDDPYPEINDNYNGWPTIQVAETLFNDLNKRSLSKNQMFKEIRNGYFPGRPNYDDFKSDTLFYGYCNNLVNDKECRSYIHNHNDGWPEKCPECEQPIDVDSIRKFAEIDWDKYSKESDRLAMEIVEELIKTYPDSKFYSFEYGDEDGNYFGALEHGGLFFNLPYVRISKH